MTKDRIFKIISDRNPANLYDVKKSVFYALDKLKKEEELKLYCFIVKSKVSGTRQIVFSKNGIVFTRAVSYEKDKNDFAEKYYQDIFSTFEYLKRIYPELQIEQLEIVNILSKEHNEKIKNSNNELAISSFTPAGFSELFGYKNLIEEDEENSDLFSCLWISFKSLIISVYK